VIERENGYLGQFQRTLLVGQTQHLCFQPGDAGPFWMTAAKKEGCRSDVNLGESQVKKKRAELVAELQAKGVDAQGKKKNALLLLCEQHDVSTLKTLGPSQVERIKAELVLDLQGKVNTKGKNKKELLALCPQHDVATVQTVEKIQEGWQGKPKGLLQVLCERGLIDGANVSNYTISG
jgi:hypothetical protein